MDTTETYKRQAAEHALEHVASGMAVGLGSGSTARHATVGLAERLRDGRLRDVVGVPTSEATAALARELGIPLVTLEERPQLDVAIDGADEVDLQLQLIKGLGGALLREKIVATAARRFIVVADETKLVAQLGSRAPLPVEVIRFGVPTVSRRLAELGTTPELRRAPDGSPFRTDEGNVILDCRFAAIPEPLALGMAIHAIPGVVEHGLFVGVAALALLAGPSGVTTIVRPE